MQVDKVKMGCGCNGRFRSWMWSWQMSTNLGHERVNASLMKRQVGIYIFSQWFPTPFSSLIVFNVYFNIGWHHVFLPSSFPCMTLARKSQIFAFSCLLRDNFWMAEEKKKNKWKKKKKTCVRHKIFRNFGKTCNYNVYLHESYLERFLFLSFFWVKVPVAFNNNMTGLNKKNEQIHKNRPGLKSFTSDAVLASTP